MLYTGLLYPSALFILQFKSKKTLRKTKKSLMNLLKASNNKKDCKKRGKMNAMKL